MELLITKADIKSNECLCTVKHKQADAGVVITVFLIIDGIDIGGVVYILYLEMSRK